MTESEAGGRKSGEPENGWWSTKTGEKAEDGKEVVGRQRMESS